MVHSGSTLGQENEGSTDPPYLAKRFACSMEQTCVNVDFAATVTH